MLKEKKLLVQILIFFSHFFGCHYANGINPLKINLVKTESQFLYEKSPTFSFISGSTLDPTTICKPGLYYQKPLRPELEGVRVSFSFLKFLISRGHASFPKHLTNLGVRISFCKNLNFRYVFALKYSAKFKNLHLQRSIWDLRGRRFISVLGI